MKILSRSLWVIPSLILLIASNNKIEIIKDKSNNKIIIKIINFLCFPKKTIKIDFENFHFYFKKIIRPGKGSPKEYIRLRIINDYKNLEGIDFVISNIKKIPSKFYYTFNYIKNVRDAEKEYTSDLSRFLSDLIIMKIHYFLILVIIWKMIIQTQ